MSERPADAGPPKKKQRPDRPRPLLIELYSSDVGKKYVMAITGVMLLGFVLVHMIGNLHLYEGPLKVNEYGEGLRELGEPLIPRTFLLWVMRLGLIGAFALHIHASWALTRSSHKADKKYMSDRDWIAVNWASRSMRWTGPIVLLFLAWHLADLTWGTVNGYDGEQFVRGDVYHNFVNSLAEPGIAIIYIVANLALGVHIFHGAWSMFQSVGINNPKFNVARRGFAAGFAGLIVLGNLSFPIAALAGLIDEDERTTLPQPCIDAAHNSDGQFNEEELRQALQQYTESPIPLSDVPEAFHACINSLDEFGFDTAGALGDEESS